MWAWGVILTIIILGVESICGAEEVRSPNPTLWIAGIVKLCFRYK
jgi:hypothetical protein